MARKKAPGPTDAELAILRVLWRRGPSTVRQVWEELEHGRRVGYTTVLKQLQVMHEKGFVKADDRPRSNIYQAKVTEEQAQDRETTTLLERLFHGSSRKLILQLLANKKPSHEELLEIRRQINEMVRQE